MKKIFFILICMIILLPVQALADDGTVFDYDGLVKASIDVKTPAVGIGETVEFTINIKNTTAESFWINDIELFGYLDLSEDKSGYTVEAYQSVAIDVSMELPERVDWYKEGDKYYAKIGIQFDSSASIPYINLYYESDEIARVEITNLHEGTGKVRMDIMEEDGVCGYTLDQGVYYPVVHSAKVRVTNILKEKITFLNATGELISLDPAESYDLAYGSGAVLDNKGGRRNSIMIEYPFFFQTDGEYYSCKETRIYPTVFFEYDMDLKVNIERFEGEYKSTKPGYENYAVKITNTGKNTINGFYVAMGEAHRDAFDLSNFVGRLNPGDTTRFYIVHNSSQPELNIYAGIVFNNEVYYSNTITCTNMDEGADDLVYDYPYNEYYPDMKLTISDDVKGILTPKDKTSTEAYDGPRTWIMVTNEMPEPTPSPTPKPTPKPTPTKVVVTPRPSLSPIPSEETMTVTVEKRSLIPVWVFVALPLVVVLAAGAVLFLRKRAKTQGQ